MARQAAGQFHFKQNDLHDIGGGVGGACEIVDGDRRRAEKFCNSRSKRVVGRGCFGGGVAGGRLAHGRRRNRLAQYGVSTSITTAAEVTSVAPSLRSLLVPPARGSIGEPGTANTSRPASSASRAVMSEPERSAASTTTTPSDMPAMIRLRRGKSRARGSQPKAISETRAPPSVIWSARSACSAG